MGVAYKSFATIVHRGEIGYVVIGKTKRFTTQELDKWLNSTMHHTGFINAGKHTTHIYRSSGITGQEYILDALVKQRDASKLKNLLSKKYPKSKIKIQFNQAGA